MSKKYDFYVLNAINKELGYLKEDIGKRFLGKSRNQKRKIDVVLLGAARAISLKQSLIEEETTKNHEHILKDINKELTDSEDIIFLAQLMGYFSQFKKKVENPHHIIFNIDRCLKIARSYFESSWNLGSPTYQEIVKNTSYLETTIISELFDKIKNIEEQSEGLLSSVELEEEENID